MLLMGAGKIPVVKMVHGPGNKYMFPAWLGNGDLRFSSVVYTRDNNDTGYWWANVPRTDDAPWDYGYTSLAETEVLRLAYTDPVTTGIPDADYEAIIGGAYKTILMLVGSGSSQAAANLMVMGAAPKFAYFTYTIESDATAGKMVVLTVSPTSIDGYHAVACTDIPFGSGGTVSVDVKSEDDTVSVKSTMNGAAMVFDLSVKRAVGAARSEIRDITVSGDTLVITGF